MATISREGYMLVDTKGQGAARYMIKDVYKGTWEGFSNDEGEAIEMLDRLAAYGVNYFSAREALENGYEKGDTTLQRGYIKANEDPMKARVYIAGGSRKGQLYYLIHNPQSSQYCIRQYLI